MVETLHRPAPDSPNAGVPAPFVVLVVDGNSVVYRAWYAHRDSGSRNSNGEPNGAVHGTCALITSLAERVRPDGIVVAFDSPRSVRRERWPHYKAQRPDKDDDLVRQLGIAKEMTADLGLHVVEVDGWEADDVFASFAHQCERHDDLRCVLATGDRDSFPLASQTTRVLHMRNGLDNAIWVDDEYLKAQYGVTASAYADLAAIRGDTSDNLRGADGIGPKRAAKILDAYKSIPAALGDPEGVARLLGDRLAHAFVVSADRILENLEIMAMQTDLDVGIATEYEWLANTRTADEIAAAMIDWELLSLIERASILTTNTTNYTYRSLDSLDRLGSTFDDDAHDNAELKATAVEFPQGTLF